MIEKRPRQYAFGTNGAGGIVHLKTREERQKALGEVPEHLRPWVKELIEDAYKYGRKRIEAAAEARRKRK